MQQAIELARGGPSEADLYTELAFQTLVRAGMWGVAPRADLVEGWIERAVRLAGPESEAHAKALIARCYSDYDKSRDLAGEASGIAERIGDPVIRSYGFDVLALTAFAAGNFDEAVEWQRRRLSLVGEIGDPVTRQVSANAIAPSVRAEG